MTELVLAKTANGALMPVDPQSQEFIAKMKLGAAMKGEFKRLRNPKFHRKFMALMNVAFDAWEPGQLEYKGEAVQKEFDRFRKDITILAGYYETAIDLNGKVRLTAKSINFNSMDEDTFERLYSAVINVILSRILTNYSRADLDNVVEQVMAFS